MEKNSTRFGSLISLFNERYQKVIVNLPLGFGKSVQTINLAKQGGFGDRHLIVVNTRKEVDRFRRELSQYFWYYQTNEKREKYLLMEIKERTETLLKLDPDREEYEWLDELVEELQENVSNEKERSFKDFDFNKYTGAIITKKKFNELLKTPEEYATLNRFKTITFDEISDLEFTVRYEFKNINDSTLKGIGKINLIDFKNDSHLTSVVESYEYKDINNFFELLSNKNENYFIEKNRRSKSYLHMKNEVLFEFFRQFEGKIMILDATADLSDYIYAEFNKSNDLIDYITEENLIFGLRELLKDVEKLSKYYKILEIEEERIVREYLDDKAKRKELVNIVDKKRDYFNISSKFMRPTKYNAKKREYPNLEVNHLNLKPINQRDVFVKMTDLRFHYQDSKEKKKKKLDIIKQLKIPENLVFTNKATAEALKESDIFPGKEINHIYSGDDIGSNLYKDYTEMCILYGQTMSGSIVKMLSLFFNRSERVIKEKIIAQRMIQLIGRTKIRQDHLASVKINIIQYPELNLAYINQYFSCNINQQYGFIAELEAKKISLLDILIKDIRSKNLKEIKVAELVKQTMQENGKIDNKNTQNSTSNSLKKELPNLGYVPKTKANRVWIKIE